MAHLPQPDIILKKNINLSFMYILATFILLNYKKILRVDPELQSQSIFRPKKTISQNVIFEKTIKLIFMFLLAPFTMQNNKKKSLEWIQSYNDMSFSSKDGPLASNKFFFSVWCTSWPHFTVQNFKKSLKWIQSYEVTPFSGPKWPIFSK